MNSASRSNPRRRQRNSSDDSVAIRQPVKRRKRSALTHETFQSPEATRSSKNSLSDQTRSLPNGHADDPEDSEDQDAIDETKLTFRNKSAGRQDQALIPRRQMTSELLTENEYYAVNFLDTTPPSLTSQDVAIPWQTAIYPQYGHAVAATHDEALVWPYKGQNASSGSQRCIRVRLSPPKTQGTQALPLARITKLSSDLSLLIVQPNDGKIVFWESLTDAATADSNRQRQQSIHGNIGSLFSNEIVTSVEEAESRGFVISLSSGRLVHLSLGEDQGKTTIKTDFMKSTAGQTSGIFGSLRGVLRGPAWKPLVAVRAADSKRRGQRYIVSATSSGTFQIWDMNWNGTHSLDFEIDMRAEMLTALETGIKRDATVTFTDLEILDFTLPAEAAGHGQTFERTAQQPFSIIALGAIKVRDQVYYAIISVKISKQQCSVKYVRLIKCFSTSETSETKLQSSILVPWPGHAAVIALDSHIIIVSLEQEEESPSSQLKVEAHVLPEYFEDVINFKCDRPYRIVGSAADVLPQGQNSSTSIIAVQNAGLIRVLVHPLRNGLSPISRDALTARNKLEQAVFFSDVRSNFIDFSAEGGLKFAQDEVENAAIDIARAITDSSSRHLKGINPSMEAQLANRAAKLRNLIYHVQHTFRPVSETVRWELMWNAEKVAAAQELWKWYNAKPSRADDRKSVFAEMIEAIPETLKVENQPDQGETDGVRHWFLRDVWRLEWLLPYAHEIVEILYRESGEDQREQDETTKAQLISIAAQIQIIILETAFAFRQDHAKDYGFDPTLFDHGVLKTSNLYQTLPEFWTSSRLGNKQALVPIRIKEITDAAREMAKNLALVVDDLLEQQEEARSPEGKAAVDTEETFAVMQQLGKKTPRQVEICEKVYREHASWLEAQPDKALQEQGKTIKRQYPTLRRQQLADLSDLGLVEEAIRLAEKYEDMEALLDVLENENLESNSLGPSILRRVESYFRRFGESWSDAYFSRTLSRGQEASEVLRGTAHKQHLTSFLRRHSEYASLAWINEISTERDYARAAKALFQASQHNDQVWSQKVIKSLGKLSLLAAKTKDPTAFHTPADETRKMDCSLEALQMQEDLYESLKQYVKRAIDEDAAVDVVMDHHAVNIMGTMPYLANQVKTCLEDVLAHRTVAPSKIANLLSLLHDDPVRSEASTYLSHRFFLALRFIQLESTIEAAPPNAAVSSLVYKAVWRRLLIASDWTKLNRTEKKSDAEVSDELKETMLYQTLLAGYRFRSKADGVNFWDLMPPPAAPQDVLDGGEQVEMLKRSSLDKGEEAPKESSKLAHDIKSEDDKLRGYIDKGRLEEWFLGIMEAARADVQQEHTLKAEFKKLKSEEFETKAGKKSKARATGMGSESFEDLNGDI